MRGSSQRHAGLAVIPMSSRPNLLILLPDQMRADALGFMGNPVCRTPHFDRLAAGGVVFEQFFTTFPKCVPARASLTTGRYCHTDGWRSVSQTLDPGQPNLLRTLRETGYQTAVFGKNHCWHAEDWDRLDFQSYKEPMEAHLEGRRGSVPPSFDGPGRRPAELHGGWHYSGNGTRHMADEAFTDQAIEFLTQRREPERPFFLQLNWESPHTQYGVEEPWFSLYDREMLPVLPHHLPRNASLPMRAQREFRTGLEDDPAACHEVQATYYGMISKVDHLCGRVLDALEQSGQRENTIILFLSDHGDYAGQYGLAEKYDTHFSDCLLQVPCVLAGPGVPGGKRVASLGDIASLAPTLIELLDVKRLPGMHGASLLPLSGGDAGPGAVFATGGHEPEMRARFAAVHAPSHRASDHYFGKSETYLRSPESMARAQMVRTNTHKLVVHETGERELYDLVTDPFEMNNCQGDPTYGLIVADLMERLVAWNIRTMRDQPYLANFTV
jgi:arylsulfatase A-like enzyme